MNKPIKRLWICDQPHKHWYEYIYNSYQPKSLHNSKHMVDIYSFTHIFWPLLFMFTIKKINGDMFDSRKIAGMLFLLTTGFEVYENMKEQIVKYRRIEIDSSGQSSYRGDTILNIFGDILFNMIGIYIGYSCSSNSTILTVLLILFIVITRVVGFSYWTEFIEFLSADLRKI